MVWEPADSRREHEGFRRSCVADEPAVFGAALGAGEGDVRREYGDVCEVAAATLDRKIHGERIDSPHHTQIPPSLGPFLRRDTSHGKLHTSGISACISHGPADTLGLLRRRRQAHQDDAVRRDPAAPVLLQSQPETHPQRSYRQRSPQSRRHNIPPSGQTLHRRRRVSSRDRGDSCDYHDSMA